LPVGMECICNSGFQIISDECVPKAHVPCLNTEWNKYWTGVGTTCAACTNLCRTCKGATNDDCLSCNPNAKLHKKWDDQGQKFLDFGTCECEEGFFKNGTSCDRCAPLCKSCDGANVADCFEFVPWTDLPGGTACIAGTTKVLYGLADEIGSCVPHATAPNCPWDHYYDKTSLKCEKCDYSCATCTESKTHCGFCYADYIKKPVTATKDSCFCDAGFTSMSNTHHEEWKKKVTPPPQNQPT
jgi:hypothetical protein